MSILTDLKTIKLFADLKEPVLKKIETITETETFKKGDPLFKENQYADYFYAVIEGKVALELGINSSRLCRIKDVLPGEVFGISSLVDTDMRTYIANATAVEKSKVFRWKGSHLEKLFFEDYELGFFFMRNVGKILKNRLQYTRAQLAADLHLT
ncbi:MAG: Crp/Fnr family transcriptional regulator [Thermodesulfobacteriota bacterium]